MPKPRKDEAEKDFIRRCMSSTESHKTFPDNKQRVAFCYSQWEKFGGKTSLERDAQERNEEYVDRPST